MKSKRKLIGKSLTVLGLVGILFFGKRTWDLYDKMALCRYEFENPTQKNSESVDWNVLNTQLSFGFSGDSDKFAEFFENSDKLTRKYIIKSNELTNEYLKNGFAYILSIGTAYTGAGLIIFSRRNKNGNNKKI